MKRKKIILIILIIFIMSGCTIKTEITMMDDGSIKENVNILESMSNIASDKDKFEKKVNSYLKDYKKVLTKTGYNTSIMYGEKSLSGVQFKNNYKNICHYFSKNLFTFRIYNDISCNEDDYYIEIKSNTPYPVYCSDCVDRISLQDAKFIINLPINALEHNADIVNENTYSWEFNKNTDSSKNIYLKIDKQKLKEYQENKKSSEEIAYKMKIILAIILILSILIGTCIILVKKYKKNKLEY